MSTTNTDAIATVLEKARAVIVLHDELAETDENLLEGPEPFLRWCKAVDELREALELVEVKQ
jgi:hypothetical protein